MDENLGKAILQTLNERTGKRKLVCGLCGGTRWGMDGIVNLPLQDKPSGGIVIGGKVLPLANLTCEICGNTLFLNLVRLLGREKLEQAIREVGINAILEEAHRSRESKGKEE